MGHAVFLRPRTCRNATYSSKLSSPQISVRFLASGEVRNILTLRNIVEDAARMLVDVAGYFTGYGYDAEIVQAVRSNTSEKYVFGIDVPTLAGDQRTTVGRRA